MDFKKITPETAVQGFAAGFDCSQVVLAHAAEKLGMSAEDALKLSAAFGGGMWNGERCGCVTGALMAIGARFGHCKEGDADTKNQMLAKKAEFEAKFREQYSSLICRELLGYNLAVPEELEKVMEKQLLVTFCPKLAAAACEILDGILE